MTPITQGEKLLVQLEARVIALEVLVPRFIALEDKVGTFIDQHVASEAVKAEIDRRRAHIHFALLGGLITLVTGCAIALFSWVLAGHHVVVENHSTPTVSANAAPSKATNE